MSKRILALVDDLFFSVQIRDTAEKLGYVTTVVQYAEDFKGRLAERPDLVLIDIACKGVDWAELVKTAKVGRRPVIAFGNHMDLEARERALVAGADAMVANAVVATDLAGLLRRHVRS